MGVCGDGGEVRGVPLWLGRGGVVLVGWDGMGGFLGAAGLGKERGGRKRRGGGFWRGGEKVCSKWDVERR